MIPPEGEYLLLRRPARKAVLEKCAEPLPLAATVEVDSEAPMNTRPVLLPRREG